jgi:hypothetical protein
MGIISDGLCFFFLKRYDFYAFRFISRSDTQLHYASKLLLPGNIAILSAQLEECVASLAVMKFTSRT